MAPLAGPVFETIFDAWLRLMLALEGNAAEVLKEISDTSPTVLQDIWDALCRSFGEVGEAREAMRKLKQRRQLDSESVVEFKQALRSLYRVAWLKATPEQKEVALKTSFESGLVSHEMQQFLRLHALGDSFASTVQKARRFAATTEVPRTRKSVRITTPPAHEAVQLIKEDSVLEKRLDKIEDLIQSLQVTGIRAGRQTPPPKLDNMACVAKKPQRQYPTSRPSGKEQDKSPRSNQNRRHFVRPFDADVTGQKRTETNRSVSGSGFPPGRGTQNQKLVRKGVSGRASTQRPPRIPPGVCWTCRQRGCHSIFHEENRPPPPQPRARTPDVCWTCGQEGCRSWYHAPRSPTPVPLMNQSSGNVSGTRNPGNRGPTQ